MSEKERARLKEILRAIKVPRYCDVSTANISFNSDYFDEMVLDPLEKLAGWSEEDELGVVKKAAEIKKETSNGEFRKRFDHIKSVLSEKKAWIIGGSIVAAVATGIAIMASRSGKEKKQTGEN